MVAIIVAPLIGCHRACGINGIVGVGLTFNNAISFRTNRVVTVWATFITPSVLALKVCIQIREWVHRVVFHLGFASIEFAPSGWTIWRIMVAIAGAPGIICLRSY